MTEKPHGQQVLTPKDRVLLPSVAEMLHGADEESRSMVRKVASFSIFWNFEILFCDISDCKKEEFLVLETICDTH